ncbi:hypothetical protein TSTA_111210 [Talaromyces stipitatus ATCC 10500]|uniref:Uncharacterized protein n=1 Tax=Talaromyces stipitatus (strain ATCC 10500 / CBS 375.48 / QM 6759 / NRRL 1006) TaxID=441959 RepID=B8M8Y2_TALSN|nr:uncharacterized protein TSTA_111210 [Talaromyces stipitatus ATCC 10500]EED17277.1 hypothetical protein TSTA_111210 [Talaromyces stipitatus ATCC 10500]
MLSPCSVEQLGLRYQEPFLITVPVSNPHNSEDAQSQKWIAVGSFCTNCDQLNFIYPPSLFPPTPPKYPTIATFSLFQHTIIFPEILCIIMNLQEYDYGHLPEYLVRSIKENPEHESAVFEFLEASQRLARVAEENVDVKFYFFPGNTENSSILQPSGLVEDIFLTEPDKVQDASRITPNRLNIQNEPRNEAPPSDGLIDWSEWLVPGDFEHNWTDKILPSTVHENPITSLPTTAESLDCSTRENNKVVMLANRQPTAEDVSGEGDNFILQAELDQRTDCDGDPPTLSRGCPVAAKVDRPSKHLYGSKKGQSMKVKKAKRGRSTTQVNPTHKRLLKSKSSDVNKATPETTISHQRDESHSVMRHSNYAQMWSLFGPGSDSALQETHLMEIFSLATLISRPNLASFLEMQSQLWQTDRFWNPDPLRLPVAENLPTDKSCYRIFRYLQDLKEETQINAVRRRFAQIQFHLTFVRLQKEMDQRDRNKSKISSHVIDYFEGLGDHDGEHPDRSSKDKDRQSFINNNSWGRKWLLVSHYVGWGSLIVWNSIDSKMLKLKKPKLKALITYIVNAKPEIVALCREYEKPAIDLVVGRKPTLVLTQEDVARTIAHISREINANESTHKPWQQVDMDIETDKIGLVH